MGYKIRESGNHRKSEIKYYKAIYTKIYETRWTQGSEASSIEPAQTALQASSSYGFSSSQTIQTQRCEASRETSVSDPPSSVNAERKPLCKSFKPTTWPPDTAAGEELSDSVVMNTERSAAACSTKTLRYWTLSNSLLDWTLFLYALGK